MKDGREKEVGKKGEGGKERGKEEWREEERGEEVGREKGKEEGTKLHPYLGPVVQWQMQWLAAPLSLSSWPPPPLSSVPGRSGPVASQSHSCCGSP